ncbi:MAG TPA: hypothetical protein DE036_02040 [Actinobacteria bacterium]|nr:hypothetical protein [Actinomycetota bacterium]
MDNENGLQSDFDNDEEKPKTLLSRLKTTSLVVKILVVAGFLIILSNVFIIAYVSSVTTNVNVDSSSQDGASVDGQPADSRKPMKELDYEKQFVDDYEMSMLLSGRLLKLADVAAGRDGAWHKELSVDITLLKTLANNAQEVVPPASPGYQAVHKAYLEAFVDFKWAADNLSAASAENDKVLQERCIRRLYKGRARMNDAVTNLKNVYSRD